jgi:nanoRNase/pAp phosphatase (c-di-AMP/oligoRNAs hydrolase)
MGDPPQTARFDLGQSLAALAGRKAALIYTHDNPDPDALASGLGLGRLFEHELGTAVTLGHGGIVGRAQNRAMVETLGIQLTAVDRLKPDTFDLIALVDSQPETGNNSLPLNHRIDVVIDHHPARPSSGRAPWCDVRANFGATSTIVFEYLRARGVPIDAKLATAFFFALRTETRDLGREATAAERSAYIELVPLVDHSLLYRMSHPKVPRAHFAALDRALRSAEVFGQLVAVNLGTLGYPDLVAEIADLLLSYESARIVLCLGEYNQNAYLSLRTEVDNARAGAVMRHIVAHDGAAGGHGTMAGARLHGTLATAAELEATFREMVRRLVETLAIPVTSGEPLLKSGSDDSSLNDDG